MTSPAPFARSLAELSASVLERADQYREAFVSALPFKHVVIEDFFDPAFARQLLDEFPSFDPALAQSESGQTGGKAVQTNIRSISPAYQRLYETIAGRPFLDVVSRLSGIPDLLLDPKMYGGGTHENLHGQELDPHVDFNYDESVQLHRRLNLIVYLNPEWRTEWGGAIEIHSNPRKPFENRIEAYDPLFNRCVMFETNEYSWHGFPKINLPEDKRHLSRKSISIYLYTRERPAQEVVPMHGTFYVQRPLPERFTAGYTLSTEDAAELARLLIRRDTWIELYQKMELEKNGWIAELGKYIEHLQGQARAPLTGYILQEGDTQGFYGDTWAASRVRIRLRPLLPVKELLIRGFRPPEAPAATLQALIDGTVAARTTLRGEFALAVPVSRKADQVFELELACDSPPGWAAANGDDRDLAFVVNELRARHPGVKDPGA
jgi:2OG-Fe(II) oxygenase superfamily